MRSPRSSRKWLTVLPVPSPSRIPLSTHSSARAAAARLSASAPESIIAPVQRAARASERKVGVVQGVVQLQRLEEHMHDDATWLDIGELRKRVLAREVSPIQLTGQALARIR